MQADFFEVATNIQPRSSLFRCFWWRGFAAPPKTGSLDRHLL